MNLIRQNAFERPGYAPYCLRCVSFVRMQAVPGAGLLQWKCRCGAEHDERACRDLFEEFRKP